MDGHWTGGDGGCWTSVSCFGTNKQEERSDGLLSDTKVDYIQDLWGGRRVGGHDILEEGEESEK